MTSVFRTHSCRGLPLKFGLALALVAGQMPAQAAANGLVLPDGASTQVPDQPDAADNGKAKEEVVLPEAADKEGPVIVTTDKVKVPKKQRPIKLGKVKPDEFTTKPQQVVKALR
ncbi:MAG: hypothetical protein JWP79_2492 [Polaromonas sp.]|jgi:hypothetical protein|nr:hypothetical protein [Polaromonas sp.]MDB5845182.1 hypothetical protein [Polaromonas sp.]